MKTLGIMINAHGEKVEIFENPDGTVKTVLEGQAVRSFKDYDTATYSLIRAGFIFY